MKLLVTGLFVFIFFNPATAQSCAACYFFDTGEVEMITYDNIGKESGKLIYTISEITKTGNELIASFTAEEKNKSGVSLSKVSGKYKCGNGSLFMDAAVAIPKEQMTPYKDMDILSGVGFVEYPSRLIVGQTFRDTGFTIQVLNNGSFFTNLTLDQTNRKVEAEVSITNRTGTWDCMKITYTGKFTTNNGSSPATSFDFKCTEWFAPGFGMVKSETYSNTNTLISSFAITSITD
ncbi:MAG: hypothetical protein ABI675_30425 [Chitinophagaceae bacterium]